MTGYALIALADMVKELGEDKVKNILSSFSCPLNSDVEKFLKIKSIEFAKQGLAKTHLIFTTYRGELSLIAYFTLAYKTIKVSKGSLTSNLRSRIKKFAQYDDELKEYVLPAPLIAQLGKNFSNNLNTLISGDELLKMACEKVTEIQEIIGGKIMYLECEDKSQLLDFYMRNGFYNFGKRSLEKDEKEDSDSKYYIQLLKYSKN